MTHVRSRKPLYRGLGSGGLTAILGSALVFGCGDESRSGSPSSNIDSGSSGGSSGSDAGGTGGMTASGGRSGSGGGGAQSGGASAAAGGASAAAGGAGGQSTGGSTAGDGGPDAGGSPGAGGASSCPPSSSGSADTVSCEALCAGSHAACGDASFYPCEDVCGRMQAPACRPLLSTLLDCTGETTSWACTGDEPTPSGCEAAHACAVSCARRVIILPDGGFSPCVSSTSGSALGIDCQSFCASLGTGGCTAGQAECVSLCESRSASCPGASNALVDCAGGTPTWTCDANGGIDLPGCTQELSCLYECEVNGGPRCPSTPTGASQPLDCAGFCAGVAAASCPNGSTAACEADCQAAKTSCAPAFDALLACSGDTPAWRCDAQGRPSLTCDDDQCWAACVERP